MSKPPRVRVSGPSDREILGVLAGPWSLGKSRRDPGINRGLGWQLGSLPLRYMRLLWIVTATPLMAARQVAQEATTSKSSADQPSWEESATRKGVLTPEGTMYSRAADAYDGMRQSAPNVRMYAAVRRGSRMIWSTGGSSASSTRRSQHSTADICLPSNLAVRGWTAI